jgi:hypothetical protein
MIASSSSASMPDLGFGKAFSRFQWPPAPQRSGRAEAATVANEKTDKTTQTDQTDKTEKTDRTAKTGTTQSSASDQAAIAELQQIDRRVRAHEMAHLMSGNGVVRGGASYTYTRGPDGKNYAVGGEVPIDASPGRTPEETLDKARTIERAALAPVDPSAQDRRVAAMAQRMAAEASLDLARQQRESGGSGSGFAAAVDLYRRVAQGDDAASVVTGLLAVA